MLYICIVIEEETPKIAHSLGISSPRQRKTEPPIVTAIGSMHKKLVKITSVVLDICSWTWTDKQTHAHRHRNVLITILLKFVTAPAGESIIIFTPKTTNDIR